MSHGNPNENLTFLYMCSTRFIYNKVAYTKEVRDYSKCQKVQYWICQTRKLLNHMALEFQYSREASIEFTEFEKVSCGDLHCRVLCLCSACPSV